MSNSSTPQDSQTRTQPARQRNLAAALRRNMARRKHAATGDTQTPPPAVAMAADDAV